MDIRLRLIQQDNVKDREDYFSLQMSVALFPNMELDNKKEYEDNSWKDLFHKEKQNMLCDRNDVISI